MPKEKKAVSKPSRTTATASSTKQSVQAKKSPGNSPLPVRASTKSKRVPSPALSEADVARMMAAHIESLTNEVAAVRQRVEVLERRNAEHVVNEPLAQLDARKPIASPKEAFDVCDTFMRCFEGVFDLMQEWDSLLESGTEPEASASSNASEMVRLFDAALSHGGEGASALATAMDDFMNIIDIHPEAISVAERIKLTLATMKQKLESVATKEIDQRLNLVVMAARIIALQTEEHCAAFLGAADEIAALQEKIAEGVEYLDEAFAARSLDVATAIAIAQEPTDEDPRLRQTHQLATDVLKLMTMGQEARSLAQSLVDSDVDEKNHLLRNFCHRALELTVDIFDQMRPLLVAMTEEMDATGFEAAWNEELNGQILHVVPIVDELIEVVDTSLKLMHPLAQVKDESASIVDERLRIIDGFVSAIDIVVDKADETTVQLIPFNYELKRTSHILRKSLWEVSCYHVPLWATKFAEVQTSFGELELALSHVKMLSIQAGSIARILGTIAEDTQKFGECWRGSIADTRRIFDEFQKDMGTEQLEKVRHPGEASSIDGTVEMLNRVPFMMSEMRKPCMEARGLATTTSPMGEKIASAHELAQSMRTELGYLVEWGRRRVDA
ncbi:MAG TPA: hypothetical protein PK156_45060 [Polyangium sp.]|nr:hypothetical protein [Polyangium sp.]